MDPRQFVDLPRRHLLPRPRRGFATVKPASCRERGARRHFHYAHRARRPSTAADGGRTSWILYCTCDFEKKDGNRASATQEYRSTSLIGYRFCFIPLSSPSNCTQVLAPCSIHHDERIYSVNPSARHLIASYDELACDDTLKVGIFYIC